MIQGRMLGYGVANNPTSGRSVQFRVVALTAPPNLETLRELGRESVRWQAEAADLLRQHQADPKAVKREVVKRAYFADTVLGVAGEHYRVSRPDVALALDLTTGHILALAIYEYAPSIKTALISLVAVEPAHLAGTPGNEQLRGLGTALVAASARDLAKKGAQHIRLHPLDAEADRFWKSRGFVRCGNGNELCVEGEDRIAALLGSCEVSPECPDQSGSDCVVCGDPKQFARFQVAAAR